MPHKLFEAFILLVKPLVTSLVTSLVKSLAGETSVVVLAMLKFSDNSTITFSDGSTIATTE